MFRIALIALVSALALVSRCDSPRPPASRPSPRIGDSVKIRGTLSEDVDCRLLKCDDGTIYSLTVRLPNYINGTRVCIHGTLVETTQCLTQPSIEVQSIRPWSSCP